jgi:HD superfamily phosphodiesterase
VPYASTWLVITWAEDLAHGVLAVELPRRWAHVQGVAHGAHQVSAVVGEDAELLVAAAFLHDVGYAAKLAHTGR